MSTNHAALVARIYTVMIAVAGLNAVACLGLAAAYREPAFLALATLPTALGWAAARLLDRVAGRLEDEAETTFGWSAEA